MIGAAVGAVVIANDLDELTGQHVEEGDELFLSGTTIQITPVVRIEERSVGDGTPGPITRTLLEDYLAAVRADTGAAGSAAASGRIR